MRRSVISGLSTALVLSTAAVGCVALTAASTTSAAASTSTVSPADGTYVSLKPSRLLDSRISPLKRPFNQGETYNLQVGGRAGVPASGVSAVVLNLTVTGPTTAGFLTAYPKGASLPNASSINFVARDTRSNLVTVPVSSDGWVSIRNAWGKTNVVVDVQGYYVGPTAKTVPASAVDYFPDVPWRLMDTRTSSDGPALDPGETVPLSVSYKDPETGDDITPDITALAVNLTAVKPQASGYLTVWDGTGSMPGVSNVNFLPKQNTATMAIVPVGHSAENGTNYADFALRNHSSGATDVVIDIVGFYAGGISGTRFHSIGSPRRIVDTRTKTGTTPLGAYTTRIVTPPAAVADANTVALVTNTTAIKPTASTYLSLWENGGARPDSSNVNAVTGQIVSNMAMVGLQQGTTKFDIYNHSGRIDVVVDVAGRFEVAPEPTPTPTPTTTTTTPTGTPTTPVPTTSTPVPTTSTPAPTDTTATTPVGAPAAARAVTPDSSATAGALRTWVHQARVR
ncbi:hypothetical protein [Terrabacter sp. NPDC080008]|uniref:hypothetical protein n=1 Tax=Terrabacter sp. NPDC080008 TaxID=3155176 RepID=UPI00344B2E73